MAPPPPPAPPPQRHPPPHLPRAALAQVLGYVPVRHHPARRYRLRHIQDLGGEITERRPQGLGRGRLAAAMPAPVRAHSPGPGKELPAAELPGALGWSCDTAWRPGGAAHGNRGGTGRWLASW